MAQITAYRAYFERHPPTHLLVASFMGYKPRTAHNVMSVSVPELPDIED